MGIQTDYHAAYDAWLGFRKGKKPTRSIDTFAYHLEENIARLSRELKDRSYKHGSYQKVVLQEKKRRDLAVAGVRDRVVHRLLYDYLLVIFDKTFDPDVWSCRQGKGLHKCLARTQKLLAQHSGSYIWRADITKFFDNVAHSTLLNCLDRKIGDDEQTMWLCREVIDSYNALASKQASKAFPLATSPAKYLPIYI
jgi:retron-type reverse transcriptase